jgi:outer membrane lipoprotein-sorting protein
MNILRRLPLSRLLLLCGVVLAAGASLTALAMALGSGPTPPPKPLATAVHDALDGAGSEPFEGFSASVTLTNHLLEGAELAGGGGERGSLTSNPLIAGASGRLWVAKDGRLRLELQSEGGDTQILYDGTTIELYDAATNTLYRYTPPAPDGGATNGVALTYRGKPTAQDRVDTRSLNRAIEQVRKRVAALRRRDHAGAAGVSRLHIFAGAKTSDHEVPALAKIEEAIAHLRAHADVSGATPTDIAGRAAYTVRVAPNEGGSLLGGAELSFDAHNGLPLRSAIYSSTSSSPVIELAATSISYGPVADSVFAFTPPANAKVEQLKLPAHGHHAHAAHHHAAAAVKLSTHGHGPSAIAVLTSSGSGGSNGRGPSGSGAAGASEEADGGLPHVEINGVSATELRTELGTLLSFERGGVRYLVAGSRTAAEIEAFARGL